MTLRGRAIVQADAAETVPAGDTPAPTSAPATMPEPEQASSTPADTVAPAPKPKKEGKDGAPPMPKPMKAIRDSEATSLKEYLDSLGLQGSVQVAVHRTEPRFIRVSGQEVKIEGHLDTLDEFIDEGYLKERWGGGTYALTIKSRADTGSYQYAGHRTVKISGPPRWDGEPEVKQPAAPPANTGESPHLVKEVMGFLTKQLDQARKPDEIPPAVQVLLEQMRQDAARRDRELEQQRGELRAAQNKEPPVDPIKDKLLGSLLDGESGRITALREQHASELRQTKELHNAEIQRIEARHDRTISDMRSSHEREIATIKQTYENQIAALNNSHQVSLGAAKATADIMAKTQEQAIKGLERELETARKERDSLRDKKDKPILEQLKELNDLKEAMGAGEGDATTVDRVMQALPAVAETVGGIVAQARGGGQAAVQAQQQANIVQHQQRGPRVVANPRTGQRFIQEGNRLVPARKRPEVITNEAGAPVEAPVVDPASLAMLVNQMEQAFRRDEEPRIVAQTGRTVVPADILEWIRQNDTEASSGLELFMQKVAKLASTSPLSSQAGRNWLRKVGKALIEGA